MTAFRFVALAVRAGRQEQHAATALSLILALTVSMLLTACDATPRPVTTAPTDPLPVAIPSIPFDDNPDPTLCGIPQPDGRTGVVHGEVDGDLHGPIIYLYDSHLRANITGQLYPGSEVEIILSQSNPTLDYYFVKTIGIEPKQEGWVPAPFVAVKS